MFKVSCFLALLVCLVQIPDFGSAFHKKHSKGYKVRRRSEEPAAPAEERGAIVFDENTLSEPVTLGVQFDSVTLSCEVTGRPAPTVHWLKNGSPIKQKPCSASSNEDVGQEEEIDTNATSQGGKLQLSTTRSDLFIDCLDDLDQANYTCVAETPTHRATRSTELKIERAESPLLQTLVKCSSKGVPARIYMYTWSRLEFMGNSVRLYCRAQGNPRPKITWYDTGNKPIQDGGNYRLSSNGDLIIRDITFEQHLGVYRCEASNEYGKAEVQPFLYPTARGGSPFPF